MTGDEICPELAVVSYLELRRDEKGAFFLDPDGRTIIKSWFIEQIRSILSRIRVPQHHYAGHRFRIGTATTAALAGVEDSTIQALGRWHSTVFLQYIRIPKEHLAQISATLAAVNKPQH